MKLRKRDVEALLIGVERGGQEAIDALAVALRRALDQPAGRTFDELIDRCGLSPERTAALHRRDPDAVWDLAAELNECRRIGPAA